MASGQGRRFGSNKLLAPLPGGCMMEYSLACVPRDKFDRLLVVTRHPEVEQLAKKQGLPVLLHNLEARNEIIRLALQSMQGVDGCMFLPGDQPLCQPDSLRRLADAFAQEPNCIHRLAWGDQGQSPVLFPAHLFDQLCCLPPKKGGGVVILNNPHLVRLTQAQWEWELWDVDTPQALERLAQLPAAAKPAQGPQPF
ncbi:MAG: nucleotidyltransferase family protein [Candidatus Fournierella pullistercoris]|uniref:Nucleotidyltransferase family protein n=1 Tax=Candidatus Allofournierella pullistercoris TaxID=2838597 RepID=A0A948T1M3_9FIRM|nr:nucleotidyltransferase family protein [Candidatus Fournierella pullistercoris]